MVARELNRAIPGRRFEAEILAEAGDTLEIQHRKLADLRYRPDVLIVYCGHNEFAARIPLRRDLSYYRDALSPSLAARVTAETLAWSPFHTLMRRNAEKYRIAIPPPAFGHRALIDVPAFLPGERSRLLDDFRRRLGLIADYADQMGAILVLIAPAANEFDYDPNRSFLPPGTPLVERRSFESDFLVAKDREASDPSTAIEDYRDLLTRAPGFAATHWRLSRLLAARGDVQEAYEHAVAARDLDGYPRAVRPRFRRSIERSPVDILNAFNRRPGLFPRDQPRRPPRRPSLPRRDAPVFPRPARAAQAVLRRAVPAPRVRLALGSPRAVVDLVETARHFGFDDHAWREVCYWGMMSYQLTGPASFDPTVRLRKEKAFQQAAARIEAGVPPGDAGLPGIGCMDPIPIVPFGDATAPLTSDRHDGRPAEAVVGASREE